jgi:methylmalonyl-CoA mutase cobalamin-binding domain/chain
MNSNTLDRLRQALVELDSSRSDKLLKEVLSLGMEPMKILDTLRSGMEEVGDRFERSEYFVSELVMAGELMKRALSVLKPHLKNERRARGKIVLGTIIGDLHDIGKEIVKSLLVSAGFEVHDLGIDVPPERFVQKARETGARIIGISALLSTSIANTAEVVKSLKEAGIRDKVKVIVGGAAARPWMIERYGVDATVYDAVKGVEAIKMWAEEK